MQSNEYYMTREVNYAMALSSKRSPSGRLRAVKKPDAPEARTHTHARKHIQITPCLRIGICKSTARTIRAFVRIFVHLRAAP